MLNASPMAASRPRAAQAVGSVAGVVEALRFASPLAVGIGEHEHALPAIVDPAQRVEQERLASSSDGWRSRKRMHPAHEQPPPEGPLGLEQLPRIGGGRRPDDRDGMP